MLYIGPRTWLDLRAKCFCLTRKQTVDPGLKILGALKPNFYTYICKCSTICSIAD